MSATVAFKLLITTIFVGLTTQLTPRSRNSNNYYGQSNSLNNNNEGGTVGENDYWLHPLLYSLLGVFIFSVLLYAVYKICRVCNEAPVAVPFEEERVNIHNPSAAPMLPTQNPYEIRTGYSPLSAYGNYQEDPPIWNGTRQNTA